MTDVSGIPMEHGLALAGVLFSLGLMGLLVRRQFAGHADVAGQQALRYRLGHTELVETE